MSPLGPLGPLGPFPLRCRAWLARGHNLLFLLLLLLHLVPLWSVPHFPSQDGPNHLYSAHVLLNYNSPVTDIYRRFYEINPHPNPNWLSHLILAGFMTVAPPPMAEKLLLTLYLLLFPIGIRYALRAVRPGAEPLALLAFPFLYNWALHMGFYNFVLGLAVLPFALGCWLRCLERPTLRRAPLLTLLIMLLYFFHLVAVGIFLIGAAVLLAWEPFYRWRETRRQNGWNSKAFLTQEIRATARRLALILPAGLVFLTLSLVFIGREGEAGSPFSFSRLFFFDPGKFLQFISLSTMMISFRDMELLFILPLTGLYFVLAIALAIRRLRGPRRLERADGLILVALAWLGAFLLAPSTYGDGAFIYQRMALFPYLALLLWFASAGGLPRPLRLVTQVLSTGLAVLLLLNVMQRYAATQNLIEEYLSAAPAVPRGSAMMSICLAPWARLPDDEPTSSAFQLFPHLSNAVALERGCVNLSDAEGRTTHSPTRFRPELSPLIFLGRQGIEPEMLLLDPAGYERRTGQRIETVLIWDSTGRWLNDPLWAVLRQRLEQSYRVVFVSRPNGWMTAYRRNPQY